MKPIFNITSIGNNSVGQEAVSKRLETTLAVMLSPSYSVILRML